jgi:CO/xanthine dehydrogenase Mo-binding subunit
MGSSVLGERVPRKEDPKFLTTGGVYVDDLRDDRLAGATYVVFARSPIAHGTIVSIEIGDAIDMPGVIGVFTAESLGLAPVPWPFDPPTRWPDPFEARRVTFPRRDRSRWRPRAGRPLTRRPDWRCGAGARSAIRAGPHWTTSCLPAVR